LASFELTVRVTEFNALIGLGHIDWAGTMTAAQVVLVPFPGLE